MAKIKIQNISINDEQQLGAEILEYYQAGDTGAKGVRVRGLIEVGFAIRKISPTLFQVLNSMAVDGNDISPEKLSQLIKVLCGDDQASIEGEVKEELAPKLDPVKSVVTKPKGGLNEL